MFWQLHESFKNEYRKALKKMRSLDDGFSMAKRLLAAQFDPNHPQQIIAPGKIHRIMANTTWEIWKLEMVVPKSGLRPNQWPRIWFAVAGNTITFLTIGSHTENYDDNKKNQIACNRYSEIS
jgi:hypothetical protein